MLILLVLMLARIVIESFVELATPDRTIDTPVEKLSVLGSVPETS